MDSLIAVLQSLNLTINDRHYAVGISFFLLNMATMPHWMIEGNILYGVICGYTLYRALGPAKVQVPRAAPGTRPSRPRLLNDAAAPTPELSREAEIVQFRIKAGMTHGT